MPTSGAEMNSTLVKRECYRKLWGRYGGGAGNRLEVSELNIAPAPEVLRSKTSKSHSFITPVRRGSPRHRNEVRRLGRRGRPSPPS